MEAKTGLFDTEVVRRPYYSDMLLPDSRWSDDEAKADWETLVDGYYAALYNNETQATPNTYDFTNKSLANVRSIYDAAISILEEAYNIEIDLYKKNSSFEGMMNEFFHDADEVFIGPEGAEELLQTGIKTAKILQRYAEAIK